MTTVVDGRSETVALAARDALTVVSVSGAGRVTHVDPVGGYEAVGAGATAVFGPYAGPTVHRVEALNGNLTYSTAPVDYPTATEATAAAVAAAAVAAALLYVPVAAGTIGDVVEIIGSGAPAATAHGTLTVNPTGDDNGLIYTSVAYGAGANAITIRYVDPAANNAALSVSVLGSAITVNLATGVAGAITSTAAEVKAAIDALPAAAALVTVAIQTADSGSGDDGSGVVTAMASAPLTGGAGVGIGVAGICSRYSDITNGKLYLNSGAGTKAVPVWKIVTSA